jgi:hypothetical protein
LKVDEDEDERDKPGWVNFKKAVWHDSFWELLELVATYSKIGYWANCGDSVRRWLFPLILILSADYEEQQAFCLFRLRLSAHID